MIFEAREITVDRFFGIDFPTGRFLHLKTTPNRYKFLQSTGDYFPQVVVQEDFIRLPQLDVLRKKEIFVIGSVPRF